MNQAVETLTYLSGWDHDTDLLNGLGELIRLNGSIVVEIEILEGLEEDGLFVGVTGSFLGQLLLEGFLETVQTNEFVRESVLKLLSCIDDHRGVEGSMRWHATHHCAPAS